MEIRRLDGVIGSKHPLFHLVRRLRRVRRDIYDEPTRVCRLMLEHDRVLALAQLRRNWKLGRVRIGVREIVPLLERARCRRYRSEVAQYAGRGVAILDSYGPIWSAVGAFVVGTF